MKKTIKEKIILFLAILCCMTGCGPDGNPGEAEEAGIVQRKERKVYDLTENTWEDAGEVLDSRELWTVTEYWEEAEPETLKAGMRLTGTQMTEDGTDYYILSRYSAAQVGPGSQQYYLTRLNLQTLEEEKTELKFVAAEESGEEGIQELAKELTKDLDENGVVVDGMSVMDGKMRLMAAQMDRESKTPAHYYMIWMNEQGEMERAADLLPEVKAAGLYKDGLLPYGLICDREGYFFLGTEEASTGVEVGIFDKDGKFIKKLESPYGAGSVISCTGRLPEGNPVFECFDSNSEKTTIFYFDGQEEKVLYHGECEQTWVRTLNDYGEILYLGYGGLMRWDAAEGECRRIYKGGEVRPLECRSVKELSDDCITMIFKGRQHTYLYKLCLGAEMEEKVLSVYQMFQDHKLSEQAEEYSAKHPGIRIEVTARDYSEDMDMALNRLMADLAEGKGPDILVLSREQMKALQGAGALAEISDVLGEDVLEQIFPAVRQYGTISDGLYGISYAVQTGTVMVSKELWQKETWTFRDMMKLMESSEKLENVAENHTAEALLTAFCLKDIQTGNSSLVDIKGKECRLDTEEFVQLLEFCMKYGAKFGSPFVHPEQERENVLNKKTLTYSSMGDLMQFSADMAFLKDQFYAVGFPTESNYGGFVLCSDAICLNVKGENKEEAADFLQYMLSYGTQKKTGPGTVRRDVLTQNVREGTGPEDPPAFMIGPKAIIPLTGKPDGSSFLPEYLEIMEKGWPDFGESEIEKIIMEEAGAYFNGDKTAEETAKVIQSRVNLYLNEKE